MYGYRHQLHPINFSKITKSGLPDPSILFLKRPINIITLIKAL